MNQFLYGNGWKSICNHPATSAKPHFVAYQEIGKYELNKRYAYVGLFEVLPPSEEYPTIESFEKRLEELKKNYELQDEFLRDLRTNANEEFLLPHLEETLDDALKKMIGYGKVACERYEVSVVEVFTIIFHLNQVFFIHRTYKPMNSRSPLTSDEKMQKIHSSERFPVRLEILRDYLESRVPILEGNSSENIDENKRKFDDDNPSASGNSCSLKKKTKSDV